VKGPHCHKIQCTYTSEEVSSIKLVNFTYLECEEKFEDVRMPVLRLEAEHLHNLRLTNRVFELRVLHKELLFHYFHCHNKPRITVFDLEYATEGPLSYSIYDVEVFELGAVRFFRVKKAIVYVIFIDCSMGLAIFKHHLG
jgi:hypothetical protein